MKNVELGCSIFLITLLMAACILAIWNDKLMIAWCSNTVLWAVTLWEMFRTLNEKLDKLIKDKEDESK